MPIAQPTVGTGEHPHRLGRLVMLSAEAGNQRISNTLQSCLGLPRAAPLDHRHGPGEVLRHDAIETIRIASQVRRDSIIDVERAAPILGRY